MMLQNQQEYGMILVLSTVLPVLNIVTNTEHPLSDDLISVWTPEQWLTFIQGQVKILWE